MMAADKRNTAQALREFLSLGETMILLDAAAPGVVVPSQFASETELRLKLSWRYKDVSLVITDEVVSATLSFSGEPHRCTIPYAAMHAMVGMDQPVSAALTAIGFAFVDGWMTNRKEQARPQPVAGRATRPTHLRVVK
jgi:hypothetical protein